MAGTNGHAKGRVVRVIGPVVDVEFPPAELPEINTALTLDVDLGGETTTITCEVAQHIGDATVRAETHLALRATRTGPDDPAALPRRGGRTYRRL